MPARSSSSARVLFDALRPVRRRPVCECLNDHSSARKTPRLRRGVSTAPPQFSEMEVEGESAPRWSQTPAAMRGSVRPRFWRDNVKPPEANKDPKKLDEAYVRFLGPGGDKLLSEETKWLAVTHKSFDHGRRGFNDRLAFLGRRIYDLETTLTLLTTLRSTEYLKHFQDPHGREPFQHPAIDAVDALSGGARGLFTFPKRVAKVAEQYGIPDVVRWTPKNPESLVASGADLVYAQAIFAILGALALEQGTPAANRVVRERILEPMGLEKKPRYELDGAKP